MLNDKDKEFIRTYVAEASTEEEKRLRRKECVEAFGLSLPVVSAITAWTTIRKNKKITVETRPVEIVETGDHANYDNTTKQAWRNCWKTFLGNHTFSGERQDMKVLCLPGKKCLEIPLYLELGFKPENITGVEGGDADACVEFILNAKKYGIQPKLGRLENLVFDKPFDVVSYDFTGPLCKNYLDIIKQTPIGPEPNSVCNTKSFFMLNVMGKREAIEGQCIIDFYASIGRPEFADLYKKGVNPENLQFVINRTNELMERAQSGERVYPELELKEKRDFSLIYVLNSLLGKNYRFDKSLWAGYVVDKLTPKEIDDFNFGDCGIKLINAVLDQISDGVPPNIIQDFYLGLPQILEMTNSYRPFIYDRQQYKYVSPINNANSPFLSEMLYLYTPMADYLKARYIVRFILDGLVWLAKHQGKINQMHCEVRDKNGHLMRRSYSIQSKDTIALTDSDGFIISSIQYGKIVSTFQDIVGHLSKDVHYNDQIKQN